MRTQIEAARESAVGAIPPPLVDSPKCPRCSLVTLCLPDETRLLSAPVGADVRRLTPEAESRHLDSYPTPVGADVRRLTPEAESRHLDSYPTPVGADVRRLTPSPPATEQPIRRRIAARGTGSEKPPFRFDFRFTRRNRRPPTDPVNALLSLAYSLLAKDCTLAVLAVGFDPCVGFYHQPRFGRPALALDLMEEFRPLVAESAVLSCVNNRVVSRSNSRSVPTKRLRC